MPNLMMKFSNQSEMRLKLMGRNWKFLRAIH
jgi:hypothetical protein